MQEQEPQQQTAAAEAIKVEIAKQLMAKTTAVSTIAMAVMQRDWKKESPSLLEDYAVNLRTLAYQIRHLKAAELGLGLA